MSRNLTLGVLAFAFVVVVAVVVDLVSSNLRVAAIFAIGASSGVLLGFGRKWYHDILLNLRYQTEHLQAVSILSDYIGDPPIFWSVQSFTPAGLSLVLHILRSLRVVSLLELGSGISTAFIAKHFKQRGSGIIDSFDHDARWATIAMQNLVERDLAAYVNLRTVPLTELKVDDEKCNWYALPELGLDRVYDMILIDGPPCSSEKPLARLPALYELRKYFGDKCVLVLDDANREWEAEVARRWERDFPTLHFRKVTVGSGLLIVSTTPEIFDLLPPGL